MSSLLKTIAERWQTSVALCALVDFSRVYSGKIPSTKLTAFPYVSILATQGVQSGRSDKTRYSTGIVSFHVWVDEGSLETALSIAKAITDEYADNCWGLGDDGKVIDVLDMGEPTAHEALLPTVRIWEVIKLFTVHIERNRAATDVCCADL